MGIPDEARPENVQALTEAIDEFGVYGGHGRKAGQYSHMPATRAVALMQVRYAFPRRAWERELF